MRASDAYKLLYQGVFGVGHIMGDGASERLEEEARRVDLEDQPGEPLIEAVSADGSLVRVNLRPYLRRGLPLDRLFKAMKKTTKDGECEEFLEAWNVLKKLEETGVIHLDRREIEDLERELREEGCRPHHHSEVYRAAYYPGYRVVSIEKLRKYLPEISLEPV